MSLGADIKTNGAKKMHAASALPLISVVTPVLNGEKFIKGCIGSVISQRYPSVEHIIVGGSSTDNTVNIVESSRRDYNHITLISEKDSGQSDALNKGIRAAKAEYVGILNVDDFYEPNVFLRVGRLISGAVGTTLLGRQLQRPE